MTIMLAGNDGVGVGYASPDVEEAVVVGAIDAHDAVSPPLPSPLPLSPNLSTFPDFLLARK
jgi:hypothetical protein